jgi:outer membrane protein
MNYFCPVFQKRNIMKLLKISLLLSLFFFVASTVNAQKFGHINTGNLLTLMPETKTADEKLKAFQDSLVIIGEQMAKKLETDYLAYSKEYREGNLTPVVAKQRQDELEKKRNEIAAYEEVVIAKVSEQREKLLSPILVKLQEAVNAVGKEGGYTMIFDVSVLNTILFAKETDDIEPLVKAKLGLK